jgi:hypothetical protein
MGDGFDATWESAGVCDAGHRHAQQLLAFLGASKGHPGGVQAFFDQPAGDVGAEPGGYLAGRQVLHEIQVLQDLDVNENPRTRQSHHPWQPSPGMAV